MSWTISARSLRHVCPSLSVTRSHELSHALGVAMHAHHINTGMRAAAFIAQIAHETGEFRFLEEIWGPSTAQAGYWHRRDLGNFLPWHGKAYKGRGMLQITGRSNYRAVGRALGVSFLRQPHQLAWPKYAALSAAWWWHKHDLNELAQRGRFRDVTRVINGGFNGLADRQEHYRRALQVAKWLVPRDR